MSTRISNSSRHKRTDLTVFSPARLAQMKPHELAIYRLARCKYKNLILLVHHQTSHCELHQDYLQPRARRVLGWTDRAGNHLSRSSRLGSRSPLAETASRCSQTLDDKHLLRLSQANEVRDQIKRNLVLRLKAYLLRLYRDLLSTLAANCSQAGPPGSRYQSTAPGFELRSQSEQEQGLVRDSLPRKPRRPAQ